MNNQQQTELGKLTLEQRLDLAKTIMAGQEHVPHAMHHFEFYSALVEYCS